MSKHICSRCHKEFKYKSLLQIHLNRKRPCKPNNILVSQSEIPSRSPLKFIDLFCGIGGFHQALTSLGCECVMACDIDKKCREVYQMNYGITPHDDIKTINEKTMPDFDILCGGFPCQPFSNGGKKKSFADERGLLFDQIMRIARHKKPRFMFLENVKHIMKVSDGKVIEYIKQKIDDAGYYLQLIPMSPHRQGIPQQRERIFFVCIRKDIHDGSPIALLDRNLNLKFTDILEKEWDSKYRVKEEIIDVLKAWDEMIQRFEVGEKISPTILIHDAHRSYTREEFDALATWRKDYMIKNRPLLAKYKTDFDSWYARHREKLTKREIYGKLEWQTGPIRQDASIFNYFIQMRQSGIRVKKSEYFPTLVAMVQIPIYGKEKRYLTPRECARLQSFPDTFRLHPVDRVTYKQMGNSVNVHNTKTVIESTLRQLKFIS